MTPKSQTLSRRIRRTVLHSVNQALKPLGLMLYRSHPRNLSNAMWIDAARQVLEECDFTISAGPFVGTRISQNYSWSEASIGAVVAGSYEAQLHPTIEELIGLEPDVVVNIGAAEGIYAVGLARRLPKSHVIATDISKESEIAVRANSELNGVEAQVTTYTNFAPPDLERILSSSRKPAIVIDCEGCEHLMLDPTLVPSLERAHVLVELHDFVEPNTSTLIRSRFSSTHSLTEIVDGPRNPYMFPALAGLSPAQQWLVMCEGRPELMSWMWCRPHLNPNVDLAALPST